MRSWQRSLRQTRTTSIITPAPKRQTWQVSQTCQVFSGKTATKDFSISH